MYDRILVPTDGSPGMRRVVSHAAELAAVHDATLEAVYVVNSGAVANLPMESSWEGVTEMLREEGENALDAAAEYAGTSIERTLLEGNPAHEIVEYAGRSAVDVICMGTHGRGGINRLLLGSVAERVIRASEVPVLTIRVGSEE